MAGMGPPGQALMDMSVPTVKDNEALADVTQARCPTRC